MIAALYSYFVPRWHIYIFFISPFHASCLRDRSFLIFQLSQYDEDEDIDRELLQQESWELKQEVSNLNAKVIRLQENMKRKDKEQFYLGNTSHEQDTEVIF